MDENESRGDVERTGEVESRDGEVAAALDDGIGWAVEVLRRLGEMTTGIDEEEGQLVLPSFHLEGPAYMVDGSKAR
jgi:hypothetical protein